MIEITQALAEALRALLAPSPAWSLDRNYADKVAHAKLVLAKADKELADVRNKHN
jgi:ABC-type phosphate/phosphonate transport system ATPase subunit